MKPAAKRYGTGTRSVSSSNQFSTTTMSPNAEAASVASSRLTIKNFDQVIVLLDEAALLVLLDEAALLKVFSYGNPGTL